MIYSESNCFALQTKGHFISFERKNVMTEKTDYIEEIELRQKKIEKNKKRILIGGIIIVVVGFFAPLLFTLPTFTGVDFSSTGNIGSTIGGITAPFFALVSAMLVYFSFDAQVQINIEQQKQILSQQKRLDEKDSEEKYSETLSTLYRISNIQMKNVDQIIKIVKGGYLDDMKIIPAGNETIKTELLENTVYKNSQDLYILLNPILKIDSLIRKNENILNLDLSILYLEHATNWDSLRDIANVAINNIERFKKHYFDNYGVEARVTVNACLSAFYVAKKVIGNKLILSNELSNEIKHSSD